MIENRTLGCTGLTVTLLGYGTRELFLPHVSEEQAERILNAVLDAGINFIDTSPDYGPGEECIGRYISSRRSEFYLATKCGCRPEEGRHLWTRDTLLWNIDLSLKRMKVDYVDILQLHNPTVEETEAGKLVDVLQEIRDAGKTRWIGCSSTVPDLMEYVKRGYFDAYQIPYSALGRRHEEQITAAAASGCGTIVRGGVAKGILADGRERAGQGWETWEKAGLDTLLEGMTRMEFMLRFTNTHPHIHTNIVGTANPEHLAANVSAAERGPLPPHVYEEAKSLLAAAGETSS